MIGISMNWKRLAVWASVVIVGAAIVTALVVRSHRWRPRAVSIQGAVIRRDQDTRKELPISDVVVTASDGIVTTSTQSDASGYFNLKFRANVWPAKQLSLRFRGPGYEPLD